MRLHKDHEEKPMTTVNRDSEQTLRQLAELQLSKRASLQSDLETNPLIHELQVHKIELELQNEELRRTQGELDRERARYFEIYDLAPVGYCTISGKGLILEANLTAATMWSVARGALIRQPLSKFIIEEDRDRFHLFCKQVLLTTETQVIELRVIKNNGTRFWVHLVATSAQETDGSTVFRIVLSDLTARKLSEEKQQMIIQTSTEGFWMADVKGHILDANESYCKMSGYSLQELQSMSISDLDCRDSDKDITTHIKKIMANGEDRFEAHHRHKNGTVFDVEASAQFRPDDGGLFVFFVRNITQRKLTEKYRSMALTILQILNTSGDLQDSLKHVISELKTGMGFDTVGIRLKDGDDFPYFSHAGFSDEFLLTENSLITQSKDGCVHRDNEGHAGLDCTCGLVISGRTDPADPFFTQGGSFWTNDSFPIIDIPFQADTRQNPRNVCMHQGYASMALVPIRNKDTIVGLIQLNDHNKGRLSLDTVQLLEGIGSHIGSAVVRKQMEIEKETLNYQLNQAQKMETVGQLAGGVAHDFNNKLMVIMGYVELIEMELDNRDKVLLHLREIYRAAEQSRDITYRLLLFSRQQVINPQNIDVNKVIAETLKSLSRLIGEHITVSFTADDKLWSVMIDPVQLDQVIMNLAINARDAMPDGGTITIETGNVTLDKNSCSLINDSPPGDYVRITFSDTGTGMSEGTLSHVFEPFFTTKDVGKGTGLGLATIYGIIKQSNGFIGVNSTFGCGTDFKVYIPRNNKQVKVTTRIADATAAGGNATILLVEDEDAVRNVISLYLKKIGYTVYEAATPGTAVELVKDHSILIDLVLTDIVMPEMNGTDMMKKIRTIRPDIKCIFASGYSTDHISLGEVGIYDRNFIQKPYDFGKLSRHLKRVINGS